MSSHREAPEISKDPVADNTDVYAFVSPDKPDTVTLIANFIPFQNPQGGPNFYEFGDDVRYEINISNRGDAGDPDVVYQFWFHTKIRNARHVPLQHRADQLDLATRPGTGRSSTACRAGRAAAGWRDARGAPALPAGERRPPQHPELLGAGRAGGAPLAGGRTVFAGQRADGFYVDLGSIFDLGTLRPFQMAHLIPSAAAAGVNGTQGLNVHTIAIQVPKTDLTGRPRQAPPTSVRRSSVIGVWASASRQKTRVIGATARGRRTPVRASRSRAWATRCSTRSSRRWPRRTAGTRWSRATTGTTRSTSPSPSSPGCCRCSTRGCSPTWRPTPSRGPTCSRSC